MRKLLPSLLALMSLAAILTTAQAATYSLSRDFSCNEIVQRSGEVEAEVAAALKDIGSGLTDEPGVLLGALPIGDVMLSVTPKSSPPEHYPSPVPRQVFPQNLAEQEKALTTNELMLRFAASRKKLSGDRYRPAYHFVSPESTLNDPNGLCFWQGRWHLFYQA